MKSPSLFFLAPSFRLIQVLRIWRPILQPQHLFLNVFHFSVSVDMNHVPVSWNLRCQISQCASRLQVHKTICQSLRETRINLSLWGRPLALLAMTSSVKSRLKGCEKTRSVHTLLPFQRLTFWETVIKKKNALFGPLPGPGLDYSRRQPHRSGTTNPLRLNVTWFGLPSNQTVGEKKN